jgi:hypothetical protein
MEGAVESGERAAREVLSALSGIGPLPVTAVSGEDDLSEKKRAKGRRHRG